MNIETKKYVVSVRTIKELMDTAKANHESNRTDLYVFENDLGELSKEQERIQRNNRWNTEQNFDFYLNEDELKAIVEHKAYEELANGCREKLYEKIIDDVWNTKLKAVVTLRDDKDENVRIGGDTEIEGVDNPDKREILWGNKDDKVTVVYSEDMEEFERRISKAKRQVSFPKEGEEKDYVLLERLTVGVYTWQFRSYDEKVPKAVAKFIKEKLTYCIKEGKVIIPEEYLAKGKDGIEEWRELKRSGNKNNSVEKRILRQVVADKKAYMYSCMYKSMNTIVGTSYDWRIPTLEVEGRFNKGKTSKLITKLFGKSAKLKLVDIKDEDIEDKVREYWKKILMDAYNAVDKCDYKTNN